MGETARFYTEEQKEFLRELSISDGAKRSPILKAEYALILDVLGEQQNTLQNIEGILQRIEKVILSAERNQ